MTAGPADPDDWERPSPRLRTMRRLELLIVVAVLAVPTAIGVGVLLHPLAAAGVVVLAVGAAGLGWVLTARQWLAWGYAEREADLLVRHGVLVRRLSIVPYGRMQFVDVTAGPVERWLKLATVHMHTAAAASDARIPGLGVVEATRLRDRLAALGEARAAGL